MGKRILKWFFKLALGITILGGVLFLAFYKSVEYGYWGEMPNEDELTNLSNMEATQLLDQNGVAFGKIYLTDRQTIPYDAFPEVLIHSLIATEDARFYSHKGVDNRSMGRVFVKSILMREKDAGGGSTLTQQLAKNLFKRQQYKRFSIVFNKIREDIIARRLEKIYTKEEILELYLNTVPFSGNTYGIESAAQKFFNTSAKNLNVLQAATLVGTLKANHTYNPQLFPEKSLERRNVVLSQMQKYGYLTEDQVKELKEEELQLSVGKSKENKNLAAYFQEQVRRQLESILAEDAYKKEDGSHYDVYKDGLKVYTTLDVKMQEYAENSMKKHLTKLQTAFEKSYGSNPPWKKNGVILNQEVKRLNIYKQLKTKGLTEKEIIDSLSKPREMEVFNWTGNAVKSLSTIDSLQHYLKFLNTGMIAMNPHTGAILAYIGGIDYRYFQYDHIVQSKRQVGSTFKPFVYAAAIEKGVEPCDYFPGKEISYTDENGWKPRNSDKDIDPELNYSVQEGLKRSLNTISVQVLREAGIPNVIQQVHKLGITEKIENKPSIALGITSIRMVEMAKAYSCFLNNTRPVEPYFISRIEDKNGNVIAEFEPQSAKEPAFSKRTQQTMTAMMQQVVNSGTASRLRTVYGLRNHIAGKTGTTQNNADGWFVGLLPNLVTISWVGNDNQKIKFRSTSQGQGANSALPIFAGFLQSLNKDKNYSSLTNKAFSSTEIRASFDCPPTSKDGFFKRLFNPEKDDQEFDKKKKKGFWGKLFG